MVEKQEEDTKKKTEQRLAKETEDREGHLHWNWEQRRGRIVEIKKKRGAFSSPTLLPGPSPFCSLPMELLKFPDAWC